MTETVRYGGSFAPPLTDALIARYKTLVSSLPESAVKDALSELLHCCGVWWELPEPPGGGAGTHSSGVGTIIPLHPDHAAALDPHIPWKHSIDGIKVLFDGLPTGVMPPGQEVQGTDIRRQAAVMDKEAKFLRDMAHHLLWHVVELDLGREPLTTDKL